MGTKLLFTGLLLGSLGILPLKHTVLPDTARIDNALSEFYHKYPPEKVVLLTDREAYSPGETIWFSGYITCLGKPSPVSKILYVQLLDPTGLILQRLTLPAETGAAAGSLALPGDLSNGRYHLRAYTNWMLNFDPLLFFYQEVRIDDPTVSTPGTATSPVAASPGTPASPVAASPASASAGDYHLDFFPEGGNLVTGLTSRVAFRARGADNLPVAIHGILIDSSGKPVHPFTTLHDGMGSFVIHPAPGNPYTARIEFPGGIKKDFPLPTPQPSGVVLYVNHFLAPNGDDSIYFRLSRSIAAKEKYQHLILCAEMQGKVDYTYVNFDNDFAGNYSNTVLSAPSPLSLDGFPAGVLHLTVFNDAEEPLAQRLVYLQRTRGQLSPTLIRDTASTQPRGRNSFRLSLPGDAGGSYTVCVTHQPTNSPATNSPAANSPATNSPANSPATNSPAANSANSAGNLLSTLLLSSDIRNDIKAGSWYCRNADPETVAALDLLLLTSRWARFDWQKILNNEYPPIRYYAEQSLTLKGQAFWGSGTNKKPMRNGEFSLMIKAPHDSLFDMIKVPVDSEGRFSLINLNFHDTAAVYVQNNNTKKGREVTVLFERDPLDTIHFAAFPDAADPSHIFTPSANTTTLRARENNMRTGLPPLAGQRKQKDTTILSTALVRAHRKTREDSVLENYATGMFANPNAWAKTLDLTQDRSTDNLYGLNVIDYLAGKVAGLLVNTSSANGLPLVAWRISNGRFIAGTDMAKLYRMNAPAFFLDEQLLSENSDNYESAMYLLTEIPIAQVAMIRVFEPGTFAGVSGMAPHGVIAIYTKNGSEGRLRNIPSNFNKTKKTGYSLTQPFPAPDYDHPKPLSQNAQPPRSRKTLYWDPALIPDSTTHTATFSFFNDDQPGPFHVSIQGLDRNGRLLHIDTVFSK
ncbi:MG2 domain-containing protein [Puia sp.]|uniref:MG2 domain-containing protein n=1 Tax=Puia sp. TaxID=2045100 RepID=UPI002F3F3AB4